MVRRPVAAEGLATSCCAAIRSLKTGPRWRSKGWRASGSLPN